MKTKEYLLIVTLLLIFCSCNKEAANSVGTLVFTGVPPYTNQKITRSHSLKNTSVENIHSMHTANLGLATEVWVSQGLVAENVKDDFTWYKIGESKELKLIEDYSFTVNDLPVGDYNSIKLVMKNSLNRIAVYQSDINKTVEMQSSLSEESCGNEELIENYFSKNGNHSVVNGIFQQNSAGENIRGFKIKSGEVTTVFWKIGGDSSQITDCTFDWVDVNGNSVWDCGIDRTENHNCTVDMPMFSFSVEDGEEPIEEDLIIRDAVTDIEGYSYDAVKIGDQIWMMENLRTQWLNDSTFIPTINDTEDWKNYGITQKLPAQSVYHNDTTNFKIYGRLYNGHVIASGKLCPEGWHIPSREEWNTLTAYLGSSAGGKMKEAGYAHWKEPNEGANNESNFTGLPGGKRYIDAEFTPIGETGWWWSSTAIDDYNFFMLKLDYSHSLIDYDIYEPGADKMYGLSCRCIKD